MWQLGRRGVARRYVVDGGDARSRGADPERRAQPLECRQLPLGVDLDAAVGTVPHPSTHAQLPRALADEPPKADALNVTTYDGV